MRALHDLPDPVLTRVDTFCDAAARDGARAEEVGPFTLYVATDPAARPLHARPRPGTALAAGSVRPEDLHRLLSRQHELGVPRALEWTAQTAPALLPVVRAVVPAPAELLACPLLVHDPRAGGTARTPVRTRRLEPDDADLATALAVVSAAFVGADTPRPKTAAEVAARAGRIARGALAVVAAYDAHGELVGAGSAVLAAGTAEVTGLGVLPRARERGAGGALAFALAGEARASGAGTVFLTAASPAAAAVYESVGFRCRGTAHVLDAG